MDNVLVYESLCLPHDPLLGITLILICGKCVADIVAHICKFVWWYNN